MASLCSCLLRCVPGLQSRSRSPEATAPPPGKQVTAPPKPEPTAPDVQSPPQSTQDTVPIKATQAMAPTPAPPANQPTPPPNPTSPAPPSLLPVPRNASLPGDTLCPSCTSLHLTPSRFLVLPTSPDYLKYTAPFTPEKIHLPVPTLLSNTTCPLCRLLTVALSGGLTPLPLIDRKSRPLHVALSWGTDGRAPDRDQRWATLSEIRVLNASLVLPGGGFPDLPLDGGPLFPQIALLANDLPRDAPEAARVHLPRAAREGGIDFGVVRGWLGVCEGRHGGVCSARETMVLMDWTVPSLAVPDFRCVDVEKGCLVRLGDVADVMNSTGGVDEDPALRYAALSYVWGRAESDEAFFKTLWANVEERSVTGFFQREENWKRIPKTIRDAMEVTRRLGVRYLWVDSLCIIQDGEGELWLEAIRKMDNVYGAAHVVIVAAGSNGAFEGIEGVETGRGAWGDVRNIEQIGEGFRLAVLNARPSSKDRVYDTRGWTYQEAHFASRTLTLSHGTASFSCRSGLSFTETSFEDTSIITKVPESSFAGTDNDLGEIEGLIQNYSDRQFTVETDILRAFAGVGRQIRRQLHCDVCHGIPTGFFDFFLLWQPIADEPPLRRRPVAPSWSWAGWRGGVFPRTWDWYTRDMKVVRRGIRKRTWIVWHQRVDVASTECVRVGGGEGEGKSKNFYGGKHRKSERFPGIDCRATDPTARPGTLVGLPEYTQDLISQYPGSGFLQFWTISAFFELRAVGAGDDGVYGKPVKAPNRTGVPSESSSSSSDEWADEGANSDDDEGGLAALLGGLGGDDDEHDADKEPGVKLIIGGKDGKAVGRIWVPKWWEGLVKVNGGGSHEYEFIVLCEARDRRAEDGRHDDDEEAWRYRVMLVESKCDGQFFERVAIGSVGRGVLDRAVRPLKWKEFVLG